MTTETYTLGAVAPIGCVAANRAIQSQARGWAGAAFSGIKTLLTASLKPPRTRQKSRILGRLLTAGIATVALIAGPAVADWQLNNAQSNLSFISIKKGDVGEVHRFDRLAGSVDGNGKIKLSIELASVNTAIPIRDQRMREMLFNTVAFPTADLSGSVNLNEITQLGVGGVMVGTMQGELTLHGQSTPIKADLVIARLAAHKLMVSSRKPLVLQAGDYDLLEGVEKLRTVAGLPSISKAVPVSFVLVFEQP